MDRRAESRPLGSLDRGEAPGSFETACPCGGLIAVPAEALARDQHLFRCSTCSWRVDVRFDDNDVGASRFHCGDFEGAVEAYAAAVERGAAVPPEDLEFNVFEALDEWARTRPGDEALQTRCQQRLEQLFPGSSRAADFWFVQEARLALAAERAALAERQAAEAAAAAAEEQAAAAAAAEAAAAARARAEQERAAEEAAAAERAELERRERAAAFLANRGMAPGEEVRRARALRKKLRQIEELLALERALTAEEERKVGRREEFAGELEGMEGLFRVL